MAISMYSFNATSRDAAYCFKKGVDRDAYGVYHTCPKKGS